MATTRYGEEDSRLTYHYSLSFMGQSKQALPTLGFEGNIEIYAENGGEILIGQILKIVSIFQLC